MHRPDYIAGATRKVELAAEAGRLIWVINLAAAIGAAVNKRYDVLVLAGVTWLLALIGASAARRAAADLTSENEATLMAHSEEVRERHSPVETLL